MYWIVRKDNPKPEVYIPIFVYKSFDKTQFKDEEKFKIFKAKGKAISFAEELLHQFAVQSIRLFYEEGHSEKLR